MSESVRATNAQTFRGGPIPGPFVYAISAWLSHTYRYLCEGIAWPLLVPTSPKELFALHGDQQSLGVGIQSQEASQMFYEGWQGYYHWSPQCLDDGSCTYAYFIGAALDADHKLGPLHNKRNILTNPCLIPFQIKFIPFLFFAVFLVLVVLFWFVIIVMKRVLLYEKI